MAARYGRNEMAEKLLTYLADPNKQDEVCWTIKDYLSTPLHGLPSHDAHVLAGWLDPSHVGSWKRR